MRLPACLPALIKSSCPTLPFTLLSSCDAMLSLLMIYMDIVFALTSYTLSSPLHTTPQHHAWHDIARHITSHHRQSITCGWPIWAWRKASFSSPRPYRVEECFLQISNTSWGRSLQGAIDALSSHAFSPLSNFLLPSLLCITLLQLYLLASIIQLSLPPFPFPPNTSLPSLSDTSGLLFGNRAGTSSGSRRSIWQREGVCVCVCVCVRVCVGARGSSSAQYISPLSNVFIIQTTKQFLFHSCPSLFYHYLFNRFPNLHPT